MALPANYINARVIYRSPQKSVGINVLWFFLSGEPVDPVAAAETIAQNIASGLALLVPDVLTLESFLVGVQVSLTTGGGTYVAFSTTSLVPGAVDADELPSYCAVLMQKRTGAPGRQGRGRWFFPFVPETLANEGVLNAPALAAYALVASAYFTQYSGGGVDADPAHYSPFDDTLYAITSVNTTNVLATQRRRRLRQTY